MMCAAVVVGAAVPVQVGEGAVHARRGEQRDRVDVGGGTSGGRTSDGVNSASKMRAAA
ncbi:hypothetical protein [Actinoplanes sp. NPDC026623]|uniref:hypothetical protein n=1 Tax=Actinoplanes sp. NPDC026623 TaxID=3155610 RepID=UPI0033D201F3